MRTSSISVLVMPKIPWIAYHFLFGYVTETTKECYERRGVSSLNFLWGGLTKAWIAPAPFLCCHPLEKRALRKSPWQLCVLKWQAVHSQCHFIGCYFHSMLEGSCFFKCWCFCPWSGESNVGLNGRTSAERDSKVCWGTSIQPLSTTWTSRNSANSFSMESGGFIAFFEDVNLNAQVLTCINMRALYTMNYFVWGLIWALGEGLERKR